MAFCAVCICDITGPVRREPIGKDDALVAVCERCAKESVKLPPVRHVVYVKPTNTPQARGRYAEIKRHRAELAARGVCIYGEKHGPATAGKLLLAKWNELGEKLLKHDPAQFVRTLDGLRDLVESVELQHRAITKMFRATPDSER